MAIDPASLMRRLGIKDPRGLQGTLSAGAPVYNGGTPQAQQGGGMQYGRPPSQPPPFQQQMPNPGMSGTLGGGQGGGFDPSVLTRLVGSLPGIGNNQNSGMGSGLNPALLELMKRRLGAMQGYAS